MSKLNPESWLFREVRHKVEDVFLRGDDQAGLVKYYDDWIKKNPDDIDAVARIARVLTSLGRAGKARPWLERAVKLAPKRREIRLGLIDQLIQEKKYVYASAQSEAMAKLDPNDPDIIRDWGRLLLQDSSRPEAERKKAAAAVWRKLLNARPKNPSTASQVADLLRQAELIDDAVSLYNKAIELAPDSAQYREYLGEYLHTLKRSKEALAVWSGIAEGANKTSKNLGRLAEVFAGFGYSKEAIDAAHGSLRSIRKTLTWRSNSPRS